MTAGRRNRMESADLKIRGLVYVPQRAQFNHRGPSKRKQDKGPGRDGVFWSTNGLALPPRRLCSVCVALLLIHCCGNIAVLGLRRDEPMRMQIEGRLETCTLTRPTQKLY